MYLVLGECSKTFGDHFESACRERNEKVAWFRDFDSKARFHWSFDSGDGNWALDAGDRRGLTNKEIKGVLVQTPPRLDPGSSTEAREHAQLERNAIMFAWFWSLPCPVVNRYPPIFWFHPRLPLPFWKSLIIECGLRPVNAIFSNVDSNLEAFASDYAENVLYSPSCDSKTYRIASEHAWGGLKKMTKICPVNLVATTAPVYRACVVGREVFWNRALSGMPAETENRLQRLAILAGLDFLEVRLTMDKNSVRVLGIEAFPNLDGFNEESIRNVADALADLLQSGATSVAQTPLRRER
jgi:hypothetical protein